MNAFMISSVVHEPSSHLSGTTSAMGLAIARGNGSLALHLGLLIASFVAGATLSGMVIKGAHLKLGRRYGFSLLVETIVVVLVWRIYSLTPRLSQYLIAFACGLQNAMATTYSGAIIRTTHVTGIFTDLGNILGNFLAGKTIQRRRVLLYFALLGGFLFGALEVGFMLPYIGAGVILLAALISGTMALCYFFYWIHQYSLTNLFSAEVYTDRIA
jgi:Predicted membrane protein